MLFAIICRDKPGHLQTRLDARPAHLEFLNRLNEAGALKFAGPLLGEDGKPNGSLVVIEAADRTAAEAIADDDPYAAYAAYAAEGGEDDYESWAAGDRR